MVRKKPPRRPETLDELLERHEAENARLAPKETNNRTPREVRQRQELINLARRLERENAVLMKFKIMINQAINTVAGDWMNQP